MGLFSHFIIMAEQEQKLKEDVKKPAFHKKEEGKQTKQPPQQPQKRLMQIVRVAETDLEGTKHVASGIREIKGVGHMFANAVGKVYPLSDKKIMDLTEEEIKQLEDVIYHPEKYGIPVWLYNRRSDPDTGLPKHLAVSHLQLAQTTDINKMKKMKSYKGVRHSLGLPVRGQRTRSSFREKGKTIGVRKIKEQPGKAGAPKPPPGKK